MKRPRLPDELAARIEAVRGDVPFDVWVRRALEAMLGQETSEAAGKDRLPTGSPSERPPASPRASGVRLASTDRRPRS